MDDATIQQANTSFYAPGGCRDQIAACQATKVPLVCSVGQQFCNQFVLSPLAGDYDVYDVVGTNMILRRAGPDGFLLQRAKNPDPYPPALDPILTNADFIKKIGAESNWTMSNTAVYLNFLVGGDWLPSSGPQLSSVIDAGLRVNILCGDA